MRTNNVLRQSLSIYISLLLTISIVSCEGNTNSNDSNIKEENTVTIERIKVINPEVNRCLNNIGDDVKTKNYSSNSFYGNECGVTRFGEGIGLNIYQSFYQNNLSDNKYIIQELKTIASKYGYRSYSILISDNETKLMIDREIEKHHL